MMRRLMLIVTAAAAALAIATPSQAASACTVTWDGPDTGGQWTTAANWSGDTLPGAGSRVCIPAGKTVQVSTGTAAVQGVSVAGTLNVTGGTLTLTDAGEASTVDGALNLTGGTINGAADLDLAGTARWGGGTLAGTGVTRVPADHTLTVDGNGSLNESRQLEVAGTIEITADRSISTSVAANPAYVHVLEGGVVRRTTTTGLASISAKLDNDGLVEATSGTLELRGGNAGQESTGDFHGSGGTVRLTNATFTLRDAGWLGGVDETGGTVEVPSGATLSLAGANRISGGTLTGAGTVTVDGALRWSGGAIAGDGVLTVPAGRTLTHDGNTNLGGARRIEVAGTLEMTADRAISPQSGATGFVHVQSGGALRRTTTTGTAQVTVALDNDGSVTADTGTLELRGGSGTETSTGDFGAPAQGGVVKFAVGTHTLAGARWLGNVSLAGAGSVSIPEGATVTASGANAFEGGTLTGAGTFVAGGTTRWTAGTWDGSGATRIPAGATMTHDGATTMAGSRRLEVLGTLDLVSSHDILQGGGTGALVDVAAAGILRKSAGTVTARLGPALHNAGTVATLVGPLELQRAATEAHTGAFDGNAADARIVFAGGTHRFTAGSALHGFATLGSATLEVPAGSSLPLDGELEQTNGSIAGAGTLDVAGRVIWRAGNQTGPGATSIRAGGTLQIDRCDMLLRDGRRIVNAGRLEIRTGGSVKDTGTPRPVIENNGTLEIGGAATGSCAARPGVNGNVLVVNTGTIEKVGAAPTAAILGELENDGTVVARTGELQLGASAARSQDGGFATEGAATIAFDDGTFDLRPTATLDGRFDLRSQTTVVIPDPMTLPLDADSTFKMTGGTVSGGGTLRVAGAFQGITGDITASTVVVERTGQMIVGGPAGWLSVRANGELVNHGTGTWAGGVLAFEDGASMLNDGVTTITGEMRLSSTGLAGPNYRNLLHNTGTIRNASGKPSDLGITIDNDGTVIADGANVYLRGLTNYGGAQTLTGGTYAAKNAWLYMPGILRTVSAKLVVDGATAGIMYELNATTNALFTLEHLPAGGRLELRGGADVITTQDVRNDGRLYVGAGSRFQTQKSYTQTGSLRLGLGAPEPGRVVADGAANLGGGLALETDPAYAPAAGTAVPLVTGATVTGTFATVDGLAPRDGLSYALSYGVNGPVATVAGTASARPVAHEPVAAPVASSVSAPPATLDDRALVAKRGTWTRASRDGHTLSVAKRRGAVLTADVKGARRLLLVAETCRTCGTLKVTWRGRVLRRVSLRSRHRALKRVPLASFAAPRDGTLRLTLASRGSAAVDAVIVG
jgi:fibronectin-binding autotransporter adhesin